MDDDAFYVQIAAALASCQMVELELKQYITDAFALATKSIQGKMPFKFSGDDYIDSPLERLIEGFKKLSDNDELVTRLNAFKKERNFLTHRGIAHCIDYDGELSVNDAATYQERLKSLQEEASMLRSAIHWHGNAFRAHLYFDKIDDRAT